MERVVVKKYVNGNYYYCVTYPNSLTWSVQVMCESIAVYWKRWLDNKYKY